MRCFHHTASESELNQSLIHLLWAAPRQQGAQAPAYTLTLPRGLIHPKSGKPGGIFKPAKFSQHFDMNTFLGVTKIPGEPAKRPAAVGSAGWVQLPSDAHWAGELAHPTALPHPQGLPLSHSPGSMVGLHPGSWAYMCLFGLYVFIDNVFHLYLYQIYYIFIFQDWCCIDHLDLSCGPLICCFVWPRL